MREHLYNIIHGKWTFGYDKDEDWKDLGSFIGYDYLYYDGYHYLIWIGRFYLEID